MKDSGLSVRVAHSLCVDAGEGGRIINSTGDANGDAWGKRVSWVDYNGPVEGKTMGVAMLNHLIASVIQLRGMYETMVCLRLTRLP